MAHRLGTNVDYITYKDPRVKGLKRCVGARAQRHDGERVQGGGVCMIHILFEEGLVLAFCHKILEMWRPTNAICCFVNVDVAVVLPEGGGTPQYCML